MVASLALILSNALAVDLEFPRSTSKISSTFGPPTSLGAGGGGVLFVKGNWVGDKFTGTGVGSISTADLDFEMDDLTNGFCFVGVLNFDVEINGVIVGSYNYTGGGGIGAFPVSVSYAFAPIAGGGPTFDGYRVRIIARETVCPGGGSYNYFPGGLMSLN